MSLARLIYYSAVIGGWAAFVGWILSEKAFGRIGGSFWLDTIQVVLVAALVGGAIGAGLNLVSGMANARLDYLLARALPGLLGGAAGGVVGGFVGTLLFSLLVETFAIANADVPRAIGWMIMGAAIGCVDGLYERSRSKMRNGLIGGAIGGLIGGLLFDPIASLVRSPTGMASRATAFVILGICIGGFIGAVQVVLKEAWLTVLDGYRAGRQLILSQTETVLGRAEHCPLPFRGNNDSALDFEHCTIFGLPSGAFHIRDNHSDLGTLVNGTRVDGDQQLSDGDVIKVGSNYIRFNERRKSNTKDGGQAPQSLGGHVTAAPPPPQKKSSHGSISSSSSADVQPALGTRRTSTVAAGQVNSESHQSTEDGASQSPKHPDRAIPAPPPPPKSKK